MGKTGNSLTYRVKKLFQIFAVLLVTLVVLASGYSFYLINKLTKENGLSIYSSQASSDRALNEIVLEANSTIYAEDLKFLLPFLEDSIEFDEWVTSLKDKGVIYPLNYLGMKDFYEVIQPIKLRIYKKNDCARAYCFQQRLGFEEIPSVLWRGLIGVEDNRFLDHKGIDPRGILRAVYVALRSGTISQGGSTLTQQLVKNLFFTNEKTLKRKLNEIIISIYIESRFSKEQILSAYFNEVIWGSLSGVRLKGVFAASTYYFGKKTKDLTSFEASILSALLKGPYYYHPLKHLERLKDRANLVYKDLVSKSFISKFDRSLWIKKDWEKWVTFLVKRNKSDQLKSLPYALKTFDFFDQYILRTISDNFLKNIKKTREHLRSKDLGVKVIVRDLRNCLNQTCSDINFYNKRERDLWTAISEEKHQIGSLLKPFVYQIVFDGGKTSSDEIETESVSISLPSGVWEPEDRIYDQARISLGESLRKSRNITYIRMAREFGFKKLEENLKKYFKGLKSPLAEYPAQLLGSLELSMTELRDAYRSFLMESCQREWGEQSVVQVLSNPQTTTLENYVGPYLRDQAFFGKTGTSNKAMDNWFVGYNNGILVITWFGLEGERSGESLKTSGSSTAFKIYEQYKLRSGKAMSSQICSEQIIE